MEISLKIEKVKTHGGSRSGAGRKKQEDARKIPVALRLSPKANEVLERLVKESGTNKNDVINKLLESL